MAFATGQFHDIACINDIALTGKEYGPQYGARGVIITYGLPSRYGDIFTAGEIEIITTAISNHDGAGPTELDGFTKTLTFLLRDCDKVDYYRRLYTEPFENTFKRPVQFDGFVRRKLAMGCLAGKPMKHSDM